MMDRTFSQSVALDPPTYAMVEHLIEARQFSAYVRDMIRERNAQETVPGLRDAVTQLMAEYAANNGIESA